MFLFKHRDSDYSLANAVKKRSTNGKLYSEAEFRRIIERERARADRTDHQFSLIVIDLGFSDEKHHTTKGILENIFNRVRKIDEIGWYGRNRIGIILPYTSAQGALKFAENLCGLCSLPIAECLLNVYTYDADKISKSLANVG
jgi:hypothetical protein